MATKRPSSPRPGNSSKRPPTEGRVRPTRYDPFADLHAYRHRLAARFNYDSLRLLEYLENKPLPPGFKFAEPEAPAKRPRREPA
jgi:hypothetical protein